MAFTSKDGSRFTNRDSMKQADARFAAKQPSPQPVAQSDGDMDDDPQQVAEEHGPAVEVTIQHNHEAGQHQVHSKHPDGHEHHSEHGSAQDAHEHAKKLAGEAEPDGQGGY